MEKRLKEYDDSLFVRAARVLPESDVKTDKNDEDDDSSSVLLELIAKCAPVASWTVLISRHNKEAMTEDKEDNKGEDDYGCNVEVSLAKAMRKILGKEHELIFKVLHPYNAEDDDFGEPALVPFHKNTVLLDESHDAISAKVYPMEVSFQRC